MAMLRRILAGILLFFVVPLVSLFLMAATINATFLQPDVVKSWFSEENIYNPNFVTALLGGAKKSDVRKEATAPQLGLTNDRVTKAFSDTFTPAFIRLQVENIIDTTYHFAKGDSKNLTLTLNLNEQKSTLIHEIASILKPAVSKLPICTAAAAKSSTPRCRPADRSVSKFSEQLATKIIQDAKVFSRPIELVSSKKSPEQKMVTDSIPLIYTATQWFTFGLPLLVLLLVALAILLTAPENRMKRLTKITLSILLNTLLVFVFALILVWLSRSSDFGLSEALSSQQTNLAMYLVPLVQSIVGSLSSVLALISGVTSLLVLTVLVALFAIHRHRTASPAIPQVPPLPPMDASSALESTERKDI